MIGESAEAAALEWRTARALLEWQVEMGADEAILDAPLSRYELPVTAPRAAAPPVPDTSPRAVAKAQAAATSTGPIEVDAVQLAKDAAARAPTLEALRAAIAEFEHCDLKRGARNLVFADGLPGARVMVLGDAPGREEDAEGLPFVGREGALLDAMFQAIGLSRCAATPQDALYLSTTLPWRPPQNRMPTPAEIAMMRPFVARHIALAKPEIVVLMGGLACEVALGKGSILRQRGIWAEAFERPVLPILSPAYLLRSPQAKRDAWADLLALKARLTAA